MSKNSNSDKKVILLSVIVFIAIFILIILYQIFAIRAENNSKDEVSTLIYSLDRSSDLDPLIEEASKVPYVLLGESSHGTSEYYKWRSAISKRLIREHGFNFIIVEGDWDALYKINLYVKHIIHPEDGARGILSTFDRWPKWMWANEEFLEFVEWAREYNSGIKTEYRVGIYGKDIYGYQNSMKIIIDYLEKIDIRNAELAKKLYHCLIDYGDDHVSYVSDYMAHGKNCQLSTEAVLQLLEDNEAYYRSHGEKNFFNAKQNSLAVIYAEKFYRANAYPDGNSWNIRVKGMKNLFNDLLDWYGESAKGIIWAHNTHVGDARATDMTKTGMINIGQLLREKHGLSNVYIVGFGTNRGTVMAGANWGAEGQVLNVPEARPGSLEQVLNDMHDSDYVILFENENIPISLSKRLLHRAKGVVYNPTNEQNNYVGTRVHERYNAFIFIKETSALNPI